MPLVSQQEIVHVLVLGGNGATAVEKLKKELEAYPPCRIVSISIKSPESAHGAELVAVIESV